MYAEDWRSSSPYVRQDFTNSNFFLHIPNPSLTAVTFPKYLAVGKTAIGKTKTLWEIRGGKPQPSLLNISVKYDVRSFTKYIAKVARMLDRGNDSPIHRKSDSPGVDCMKKMTQIFKSLIV